jgi:hypothetical protein
MNRVLKRKRAATPDSADAVAVFESNPGDPYRAIGGSRSRHFNNALLRSTLATLWPDPNDTERRVSAACVALAAFRPKDEIEAMVAAQAVAMHHGAMECFRRAMIPEQPSETAARLRKDGANLARAMTDMLDALDRKRGKAPQVVRVERVVVQDGGRAIVGNITSGGGTPEGGGMIKECGKDPMQRGRLKNGNPSGDLSAVPHCGARTRAGLLCRGPAMPNGRCRMHGGASTGPRTRAGSARLRKARTKTGRYAADLLDLRRKVAALLRLRARLRRGDGAGVRG